MSDLYKVFHLDDTRRLTCDALMIHDVFVIIMSIYKRLLIHTSTERSIEE